MIWIVDSRNDGWHEDVELEGLGCRVDHGAIEKEETEDE